jgi:hypothetical protein
VLRPAHADALLFLPWKFNFGWTCHELPSNTTSNPCRLIPSW